MRPANAVDGVQPQRNSASESATSAASPPWMSERRSWPSASIRVAEASRARDRRAMKLDRDDDTRCLPWGGDGVDRKRLSCVDGDAKVGRGRVLGGGWGVESET